MNTGEYQEKTDGEKKAHKKRIGRKVKAITRVLWFLANCVVTILKIAEIISPLQVIIALVCTSIPMAIVHLYYMEWDEPPEDLY
jgi:membrane protein YdbS with pleckstrin-like domain